MNFGLLLLYLSGYFVFVCLRVRSVCFVDMFKLTAFGTNS